MVEKFCPFDVVSCTRVRSRMTWHMIDLSTWMAVKLVRMIESLRWVPFKADWVRSHWMFLRGSCHCQSGFPPKIPVISICWFNRSTLTQNSLNSTFVWIIKSLKCNTKKFLMKHSWKMYKAIIIVETSHTFVLAIKRSRGLDEYSKRKDETRTIV